MKRSVVQVAKWLFSIGNDTAFRNRTSLSLDAEAIRHHSFALCRIAIFAILMAGSLASSAFGQTDSYWVTNGSANWTNPAAWDNNTAPGLDTNSTTDTATFDTTGSGTVTLETNAALSSLTFSNAITPYVIEGAGTITMTDGGGNGLIQNFAGTNTIATTLNLATNLVLQNFDVLNISGLIEGDYDLEMVGAGTTFLSGTNSSAAFTTVNEGVLIVTGAITNSTYIGVGGLGGQATLVVSNGGKVTINTNGLTVGILADANSNTVVVDGPGSSLTVLDGGIQVGNDSNTVANQLIISNGANVSVDSDGIIIGRFSGSDSNAVVVTGGSSTLSVVGQITIGGDANTGNSFTVSSNAVVTSASSTIGANGGSLASASSNSQALITTGGTWNVNGDLIIGDGSSGNLLSVAGGGTLSVSNNAIIGTDTLPVGVSGSNNAVIVTGAGSIFTAGTSIVVGDSGSGSLTIGSGGAVNAPNIYIAQSNTSVGILNVGAFGGSNTNVTLGAGTITFGNGSGTINFNQADATTISSVLTGNGSVNQLGSGTTILNGFLDYSGVTTISQGTLQYGDGTTNAGGFIGTVGSSAIANNASLVFAQYNILTNSSVISGGGSVAQISSGTTILTGSNTYSGGTLISGGFLQVGNGGSTGSLGSGAVTLTNSATFIYNRADNTTLGNFFSGIGNLRFIGLGTTTLSGNSGYNGFTTVEGTSVVVTGSLNGGTNGRFIVGETNSGASLAFTGGGTNSADSIQIGNTNNSSGNTVKVDGATLNLVNTLGVGANGNSGNTMTITNGATVNSGNLFVGLDGGVSNALVISGNGSSLTANGAVGLGNFIGNNSSGNSLLISDGGTFNAIGRLYIGENGGTNNSVLVTGVGSLLTNTASNNVGITVGGTNGASGILTVASNATIAGASIALANSNGTAGSLNVGLFGANGTGGSLNVTNITFGAGSATLNFNQSNNVTIASILSGSNNAIVNQRGSGTTTLTGNNSAYRGLINITNGTLAVGTGGNLGTSNTVSNNAALIFNSASNVTVSGNISGTGTVTQSGAGTTTLSGSNSYLGGTTLTNGTLALGSSNALGAGSLTVNGASTLTVTANITLANDIVITNAVATFSTTNLWTNSGVISGNGSLTKSGTGTLTLAGGNTYTGVTTITGGQLAVTASNAIGTNALSIGGGSFNYAVGSSTLTLAGLTLSGNAAIFLTNYSAISNTGAVAVSGSSNTINLLGSWTNLGSNNLVSGLSLSVAGGSGLTLTNSAFGSLALGSTSTNGRTAYTFNSNSTSLFLNAANVQLSLLWSGGTAGDWNTSSTNWVPASGGASITFADGDNVAFGTNATIVVTTNVTAGNILITNGSGTLNFSGSNIAASSFTNSGTGALVMSNSLSITNALRINTNNQSTFAGNVTASNLIGSGGGTLTLNGSNSFGAVALSGMTVALGNNNALGTNSVVFVGGTLVASGAQTLSNSVDIVSSVTVTNNNAFSLAGLLYGTGSLTKDGAGTLTLATNATYSGTTTVTNGTLLLGVANALTNSASVAVAGSGTLNLGSANQTLKGLTGIGSVTNGAGTLSIVSSGSNNFGGVISGAGALEIGGGTMTLSGLNTYTGGTFITNGTLALGTNNALLTNGTVTVTNAGTLSLSTYIQTLGGLLGNGTVTGAGGSALTLDIGGGTNNTFAGSIAGGVGLTKSGAGTLVLSGTNSNQGSINLFGGQTVLTGVISNSANAVIDDGAALLVTNGGRINVGPLDIGFAGANSLTIASSSTLTSGGVGIGKTTASSTNNITVSGTGARWNAGYVTFGDAGSGNNLSILNGASMVSETMDVGNQATSSNNSVLVDGLNSLLSNSGVMTIGLSGTVTVTVANGGGLSAGSVVLASNSGSAGTLNIGSLGGADGAGSITASTITFGNGTGTINFNQINSFTLAANVSGAGSLSQLGSGTTILTGSNSYSGGTAINRGTVTASTTNALGTGTVSLNGSAGNQVMLNNTATGTLTVSSLLLNGFSTVGLTAGSQIASTGNFIVSGSTNFVSINGNWLGGTNTLISAGGILTAGGIQLDIFGGATLSLGGTTNYLGKTYTFTNSLNSLQLIVVGDAADLYWAGGVSGNWNTTSTSWATNSGGSNTSVFNPNDNATIGSTATINVTNTGITAGLVTVTNGSGTVTLYGGALTASSFFKTNSGTLVISNNLSLGSGTLVNAGVGSVTVAGSITAGTVAQSGAGTMVLSGSNSYSGGNFISAGALQGDAMSLQGAITNNALVIFNQTNAGTYSNVISGTGALSKTGTGSLTLSGSNTYNGGTLVSAGTLQGNVTSIQGVITNNASLIFNQTSAGTYSNVISGSGTLTKTGSGTLTLTNATVSQSEATIGGGGVILSGSGSLSATSLNVTNASFQQSGTSTVRVGSLMIDQGGSAALIGGSTFVTNNVTIGFTNNASSSLLVSNGATLTSSNIDLGIYPTNSAGNTLTLTGSNSRITNASFLTIGYGTSSNAVVISDGGQFFTANTYISQYSSDSNNTVTVTGNNSLISNSGAFQIYGNGTLTVANGGALIAGSNVVIGLGGSGGAINIGSFGGTDSAGTIGTGTIAISGPNSFLNFNQTNTTTITSVIFGTNGSVRQLGSGTTILTGSNSYTGGTLVSAGALQGDATSLQGAITNNALVIFDQSSFGTYAGNMTGNGSMSKIGAATLTLLGSNSYTGGTLVSAGALQGDARSLQGAITNNALVIFNQTNAGTYSNVISGTGALSKTGTGSLTLSGSNSYTGGTLVSAGTLQGDATSLQGAISNNAQLTFNQANAGTYSNTISGSGTLTKTGSGTLTLTNATVSQSEATIGGGGVILSGSGSLSATSLNVTNASFQQSGTSTVRVGSLMIDQGGSAALIGGSTFVTNNVTIGFTNNASSSLLVSNGATLTSSNISLGIYPTNSAGNTLTLTGSNSRITNASFLTIGYGTSSNAVVISDGGQFFTANTLISRYSSDSNNTVTVTGNNSLMSNSGAFQIYGNGTLTVANGASLFASNVTIGLGGSGGAINIGSFGGTDSAGTIGTGTIAISGPNSFLNFNQNNTTTITSVIFGTNGSVRQLGSGTTILTGSNSYSGGTLVNAGTLQGDAMSLQGAITNNALVIFNQTNSGTYSGNISGTGSLTKIGAGTLALSGTNAYSGNTIVDGGAVQIFGKLSNEYGYIGYATNSSNNTVVVSGVGSSWSNASPLFVGFAGSGNSLIISNGGTVSSYYAVIGNTNTSSNNSVLVTGNGSRWSNPVSLFIGGLGGGSGTLTVANGGTVDVGGITIAATNGSVGTINIGRYGSNDGAGTLTTTYGGITFGPGSGVINFNQTNSFTLAANVSGAGSLSQLGSGTSILTGSNSYSGGTLISSGTMVASNAYALGSGTVTLTNSGSALKYALGSSTLSLGGLVLSGGTTISLASGSSITSTGSVDFANSTNYITLLTDILGAWQTPGTNLLISSASSIIGYTNYSALVFGSSTVSFGQTFTNSGWQYTFTNSTANSLDLLALRLAGNIYWLNSGGQNSTWDTNSLNWTTNSTGLGGTPTTFGSTDFVSFVTSSNTVVTVTNSGVTAGSVTVSNTAGTLTFNGAGTITSGSFNAIGAGNLIVSNNLVLGGGAFVNSGSGSATIAGRLLSGAVTQSGVGSTILSGANTNSGMTTVSGGALLLNGTNSGGGDINVSGGVFRGTGVATSSAVALSGSGTISPGNGSQTGALSIGSLTINGGTLNILLGGGTTSLLAVNGAATLGGTLNFSTNATLTSSIYEFLTFSGSLSGTFVTTNALPTGYQLVYGSNSVYLQALAVLGPITTTFGGGTNAIITGGTTNFLTGVSNTAAIGSANLVFTATNVGNTAGSIGSTTVTPQTGTNVSGLSYTGTNVGAGQTGTFTVSASNATSSSGTGTVTVNVFDHAQGILSSSNVALSNVITGYGTAVTTNLGVSNAAGFRVGLYTTNTSNGLVSLAGVTNVAQGTSSNALLSLAIGQGTGTYTNTLSIVYGDDSSLNGATNAAGTNTLTVTGAVYDHAAGALLTNSVAFSNVIVGFGGTNLTANVGVTNSNGFRVNLQAIGSSTNANLTLGNIASLTNGASSNGVLTLGTNQGVGAFTNTVKYVFGDQSSLAGAKTNLSTNDITVTGAVYDHAAGALLTNSVAFSNVIVGFGGTNLTANVGVTNSNGFRVNLQAIGSSTNANLTLGNIASLTNGASSNGVLTLGTNQGVGAFTNTVKYVFGDQSPLAGANASLSTNDVTVTGAVYDHAAGTLSTSNILFRAHVGYTNDKTAYIGVSNAVGFRVSLATLATNSSNNLSLSSVTNVASGGSSNALLTLATNQAAGAFTNVIGVVYGDDSPLAGASATVGTNTLTVTTLIYSGQSVWATNSGNWTDFANWNLLGGTPGLDGSLSTNDTATYGTGAGGTVTLNTNAQLNALTFSNSSAYTIAGTGTISLVQGSNAPSITTTLGSHTISNALALSTSVTVTNAPSTLLTLAGSVSGPGSITKSGAGTLSFIASNSYAGGTILNAGVLAISNNAAFGTGAVTFASNATVAALASLTVTNNYAIAGSATGTFDVGSSLNFINSGIISGGALAKTGLGTLTLSTSNSYTNGTFITNGTLIVSATNALGTGDVTIASGALLDFGIVGNGAITNTLIGSGTIAQVGAGTLTLADNSAGFTGTIGVEGSNSVLQVTNTNSIGSATLLLITEAGTLQFAGSVTNVITDITVQTNASGSNNLGTLANAGSGTLTLSGTLTKSGTTMVFGRGIFNVTGLITGGGLPGSFNSDLVVSNATVTVSASNSYVGPTYIYGNGTLINGTNNALPINTVLTLGSSSDNATQTNLYNLSGFDQEIAALASTGAAGANIVTNSSVATNVLILNGASNSSFGGLISGNLSLTRSGGGTTTLSRNNTYTGGTTITNGAIIANNNRALGNGSLTLTGINSRLILESTLTIDSFDWNTTGSFVSILNPGAAYLNVTNSVSFAGAGTNLFEISLSSLGATETQLMSFGTNSTGAFLTTQFGLFDGTAVVATNNYVFSIATDSNGLSSLYVALSTLPVNGTNTISNTITYPSITFGTNSTLNITPTGNLTITTNVAVNNQSTLNVDGILSASNTVAITNGSTLSGTGTINGNVFNGGLLSPGSSFVNNPTGRLTINGNLTQTSTSTTLLQVAGPSTFSSISVNGTASLAGALAVNPIGYTMQFGDQYQFLTATGGITGAFDSINMPAGYRGRFLLGENNTTGTVLVAPQSYTQLALNQNQVNVAKALDTFIPATSGDQLVVSTSLDKLTSAQYNQAFNAIMPTFYQQIATIAFNNANAQNMQLVQRLWGLRVAEGGGFSMSGLADNFPILEGQGDGSDKGVLDSKKDILRPGLDNHWGIFVDGNGIFAKANSGNMLPGYNSQGGGVTVGLTYRVNPQLSVGTYTGYQGTYTKSGAAGSGLGTGSMLIDNAVRFGLFGTYGQKDGKGLFVNALAGGGYHNFQATRVIQYSGVNRTANSAPGAGELDTMLATGYDIQRGNFTFGPTASLQYTYLGVNSLNETGAQSLNFSSGGWNSSSMLSSVGAHAAYSWQASPNLLVVPQVNLSWQHEFMQNPYVINGNLGGLSPTFSNSSSTPIRDFLYAGIGFTLEFAKKWNTSFFYNAAAGNADLQSQNIFWSMGVKF